MMSCFVSASHKQTWIPPARLVIASLAAVIAAGHQANAASGRNERSVESVQSRTAGEPIMAVVSLRNQRITVYDANGWIVRAPVSSGQKGRETPAGIFSVIQKEAEHYSNLYDDAYMPHMQRITWSGIALHGGPLPGYPASHGCIRMPYDFAERLFDATKLGMRVIIAPSNVAPVEIAPPALFTQTSNSGAVAATRAAESDEAARKADQARLAAMTASREAARAKTSVRAVENLMLRTKAELATAERAVTSSGSAEAKAQAENAKASAAAWADEIEAQLAAAKAELQPKLDAFAAAREAAAAAETAKAVAAEAARRVARALQPVSVFISRKTQRLYVRQAFQPILEAPVMIQDADHPIGTHVFTAMERSNGDGGMRWSVVSMDGGHPDGVQPNGDARERRGREVEPIPTNPSGAMAALDRIAIPQEVLDRIAGMALQRSSLIISDETLSPETAKGTEFVIIMSGEPQGGIKFRRRSPAADARYQRPRDHLPYWGFPFAGRW
jgi:L,D-transpeptidase-like protein